MATLSAESYTGLAGLFAGDVIVDERLVETLIEATPERDVALLALADARRAFAADERTEALRRLDIAIEIARVCRLECLLAHAHVDRARVLLERAKPGDATKAITSLELATVIAGGERMEALKLRIAELRERLELPALAA